MIYTFYSYKGGVGRSMALANVAELFYRAGLRVLMVDWDLEAPGLEKFFPTIDSKEFYTKPGLLDLILDYSEKFKLNRDKLENEIDWEDKDNLPFDKPDEYLFDVYPDHSSKGKLWLLSAGKRADENFSKYANNVIDISFSDLYQKQEANQYFEWLRSQFEKIAHVTFIDSRTGLNEISGICTYQLADVVVMLTTVANQCLEGTLKILQSFEKHEYIKNRERAHQSIVIPSKIDITQSRFVDNFKTKFSEMFRKYTPEKIGSHNYRLWELMIPYVPVYSYKEPIVIPDRDKPHAASLAEAYTKISAALSMLADDDSAIRKSMPETKIKIGEDDFSLILVNPGVALLGKSYYDTKKVYQPLADWGKAPDRNPFFGRGKELIKLEKWIIDDGCRVVAICGMGGIGKTDFSLKLAKQIQEEFDYVIWRTLRDAPSISSVLEDFIKHLSNQENIGGGIDTDNVSDKVELDHQIKLLINYLYKYRCLLILDNVEAILGSGNKSLSKNEAEFEGYGQLFSQCGESYHQSCLLLTSREIPPEIANQSGDNHRVRSYKLEGLSVKEGREFSTAIVNNLEGSDNDWEELIDFYRGHPLALNLATRYINSAFSGQIKDFLNQGAPVFQDLRNLLDWHFKRLSVEEQEIMYWLAINREPVLVQNLVNDICDEQNSANAASNLQSLKKCVPLEEVKGSGFSLQPVIIEYMTEKLIDEVYKEIKEKNINLFNNLALMKATSKDYIRNTQVRLILEPLIKKLSHGMKDRKDIAKRLLKPILSKYRKSSYLGRGYLGGNILNLLCHLMVNISDFDFSGLYICQPYLQDKNLNNVKFVASEFSQAIFTQTFSSLLSVAFSPQDGKYLVTGDADGGIRLWEVNNLSQCSYVDAHSSWVRSVSFSNDDTILASGSDDETVKVWKIDTENGQLSDQPYRVFKDHKYRVRFVAFNPKDKTMLASSSFDKTVRIWDIENDKCVRILSGHTDWVWTAIFSQDGTRLVSSSRDGTLKVWDVKTGKCITTLRVNSDIQSIAFSFDDQILAAGDEKTVKLWNFKTYQYIKSLSGHSDNVRSVAFSKNGLLASASYDNTVRLWDVDKDECTKVFVGHTHRLRSIAFSPSGDYLVSGGWDQILNLWNVNEGEESLRSVLSRTDWIFGADISPDGKLLISSSQDRTLKLWDVERGQVLKILQGHKNWTWAVAFGPNNNLVASGSFDKTIKIWDVGNGKCLHTLEGHDNWIWSVAFSSNGKYLASSSDDPVIKIWNVDTGKWWKDLVDDNSGWIRSVAFSSDGRLLASGSDDHKIRLWDISTGKLLRILTGHTGRVRSLTFSPIEPILASGGYDQDVKIWDAETGMCLRTLCGHTQKVRSVSFSRDGKTLASGGNDETIRLWDTFTGTCKKILEGHTDEVRSVSFSRNADILASSSKDGTIRLWNSITSDFISLFREARLYEGMDITGVTGLSDLQKASLIALGAVSDLA